MYSKELTKGTLQPIILKLLHDKGKMYGYEITQTVKDITRGKIDISEGALYPILHKLEAEGILETEKMYIGKRVRKYYQVTSTGIKAAQQVTDELNNFISTLSIIFKEKEVAK
ncbi:PadR family transcriptional regulator [Flavobacterium rakeshii]|uniref:PadR family transcriptional regulator n=1 Tax=Flavobacterium rakeshii TaxID=1038845 RepID=A0A6N8HGT3_9FLAO|nr:PadR family transcriptional regulator [Flavobacterium rakeshii]MEE1898727.1 PadR family transcriptional regulator [Flavobacterium rakeshii]MUV04957.1 PadR family transcriptional regulator [Flavobacterium rakeshii]